MNNPLYQSKKFVHYPRIFGKWTDGNGDLRHVFEGLPIGYRPMAPSSDWFPSDWVNPDLIAYAHHIAGRTNPSKPQISLPQMIGELRELRDTITPISELFTTISGHILVRGRRHIRAMRLARTWRTGARRYLYKETRKRRSGFGSLLDAAETLGKGNLTWRFGIAPMVSDLRKLSRLVEMTNRHIHNLYKLASGKPLKRKVHLGVDSLEVDRIENQTIHSTGTVIRATEVHRIHREHWGQVSWSPSLSDTLAPRDPLGWTEPGNFVNNFTCNAALDTLGVNTFGALEAAWELIPFSWLGSWFANYGAWLDANNYTLQVSPHDMIYSMRLKASRTFEDLDKEPWVRLDGGSVQSTERKYRIPIDSSALWIPPLTSISGVTGGQLSILGSLVATGETYRHVANRF
jgi:hypothetical protein